MLKSAGVTNNLNTKTTAEEKTIIRSQHHTQNRKPKTPQSRIRPIRAKTKNKQTQKTKKGNKKLALT